MRDHIAEARTSLPSNSEAEIRTMLERTGDPAEIAAEARDRFGVVSVRPGWLEAGALVLLALGFTGIGWLAGIALLWVSAAWTTREKLIGTLASPTAVLIGALVTVFVASAQSGTDAGGGGVGPVELGILVAVFAAPLATAVYLGIKLRARSSPHASALGGAI
jgi:hypothetical protein